jgi:hypothetical protein
MSFLPGSSSETRTPEKRAGITLTMVLQWAMCEAHLTKLASCHIFSGFSLDASALAQDVITLIDEATSDAL